MKSFQDHFSTDSERYRRHRPGYPPVLFSWLADTCRERRLAWDCATGTGQAALGLVAHFEQVIATDASSQQLAAATPHARIEYRQAPAEASGLADDSVDLVTAAQAAHWFDHEHFNREVVRVLRPGGLVAIWTYGLGSISSEVDPVLKDFYAAAVGPYWPPERAHVETAYHSIPFPFHEREVPQMAITADWRLDDLFGYLSSWSATQRCREATGVDPLAEWHDRFLQAWGDDPRIERTLRWPLYLRVGSVD